MEPAAVATAASASASVAAIEELDSFDEEIEKATLCLRTDTMQMSTVNAVHPFVCERANEK